MNKYKLKGGGMITASTPTEIIEELRATSLHPCNSLEEYIAEVSLSCYMDNHSVISTKNHKTFVNDLIKNGFIEQVDNE